MEENLKILMTTDTSDGVWRYAMSLCKSLEIYKVDIHLVNIRGTLSEEQKMEVEENSCLHLYNYYSKIRCQNVFESDSFIINKGILSLYNKIAPDIIHFNTNDQITGNWECPVIRVFNFNSEISGGNLQDRELFMGYNSCLGIHKNIKSSNVIVAPSYSSLEHIKAKYLNGNGVEVIYCGLDGISDYPLEKEYIVLSAGGFWDSGKSIFLLSSLAKEIEWPLCIVEESKLIAEEQPAKQYENVFILEQLPHAKLQHFMDRSSIFIMPAKYEQFGLTVLDAAKSSCALILPDTSFYREFWGDSALYFTPYNEDQALSVLQLLISDEQLRNEMSKSALERSKVFTATKMADQYMQLYKSLLEPILNNEFIQKFND